MELSDVISDFIDVIQDDPRIRPSHVSLFLAIVNCIKNHQGKMPVAVFKKHIIKQAKVSPATFHRCINELNNYGYVKYRPSYNALTGNFVSIPKLTA